MKPLPLPVRVATGLMASAAECAKDLPRTLTGLPITVASQVMQAAMRMQQQVTELAIKGDDVLASLYPAEETTSWATFDEDLGRSATLDAGTTRSAEQRPGSRQRAHTNGHYRSPHTTTALAGDAAHTGYAAHAEDAGDLDDPLAAEQRAHADTRAQHGQAFGEEYDEATTPDPSSTQANQAIGVWARGGPSWLPDYDGLSLPQVRARLRTFSQEQLADLLEYERDNGGRQSFIGMLSRRISNVRKQAGENPDSDTSS